MVLSERRHNKNRGEGVGGQYQALPLTGNGGCEARTPVARAKARVVQGALESSLIRDLERYEGWRRVVASRGIGCAGEGRGGRGERGNRGEM